MIFKQSLTTPDSTISYGSLIAVELLFIMLIKMIIKRGGKFHRR